MGNKFTTEIFTLEKLADRRFIIPPYQRPYVWGYEQINKLIDDFYGAFERKEDHYYVGTVLLFEQKIGDKTFYQLIDGQQRFTTLWLIAVSFKILLREHIRSGLENFLKIGDELRIDFAIRKQIKAYMLSLLEKQADDKNQYSDSDIESDEYLTHIAKAVTTIIGRIKILKNRQEFSNFIYTKVHFVANTVPPDTDLNKLFATINNSGIQLEQSDILKSLLLKNIKTEKTFYSRIWEACENMNNYFERNVKQLFPNEFDWANIKNYDELKEIQKDDNRKDNKTEEKKENALTIACILKMDNRCNLKYDLHKELIIKKLSIEEITNISGKFYGSWIGEQEAESVVLYRTSTDTIKIQLHCFDDRYAKGIELEFIQNEQDIDIKILWAKGNKRRNDNNKIYLGQDWNNTEIAQNFEDIPIANYKNGKGYGIYEIIVNPDSGNDIDSYSSLKANNDNEDISHCRSIIKFPQLLLHTYRIFLKQRNENDFDLPFHSKNLLQIFKPLTECNEEDRIKDFFKCLWTVRFVFDKYVVKWRAIEDDKEEELLLTSTSKSDNNFSRTNQTEPNETSMLQSMLYFTGNYNTQIWLTPYLKRLIDGEIDCLESIDNILSLSEKTDKETTFDLMDKDFKNDENFDFETYLNKSKGTSFKHYWFQKLEYILWKEFCNDVKWKDKQQFKKYRISSKNSVEHVFPQNHEFGSKLIDEQHLNDFGNLALLNVSQNSSYSNQDVVKKKRDFESKPTFDSLKLALIYEKDVSNYNESAIENHRNEMINKIKEHYKINNQ
ncbi:MAG: DUF262 domain-containing HNH endonuclease family protein [Bacteroidales bacterium]|jgi:uncharacterized protein with ParB-like and HNH nuclease domain|nr:DUF262 domain-containing HNH endonuclease family protein [Bacteroidales bacterium]